MSDETVPASAEASTPRAAATADPASASLLRTAIQDARWHGLDVAGAIESRHNVDAKAADAVRAEMTRLGIIRQSDADGLWFCHRAAAETWLRAAELADDLAHERGNHQMTETSLRNLIGRMERLQSDHEETQRALRLAKAAHVRAEDDLDDSERHVRVLVGSALVLIVLLAWAVIA
jgi:hypothetical protein